MDSCDSFECDSMLTDETSSFNHLIFGNNIYTIKLLLKSCAITHECFATILKDVYPGNTPNCQFTIELADMMIDYADTELLNMFIEKLTLCTFQNEHDSTQCIYRLINAGGSIPKDTTTAMHLPSEIINEHIDLESLSSEELINFAMVVRTDKSISEKCMVILQSRDTRVSRSFLSKLVSRMDENIITSGLIKYIIQQEDFEWILIESLHRYLFACGEFNELKFHPKNYVAGKKLSVIMLMTYQTYRQTRMPGLHPTILKYRDVNLREYFADDIGSKITKPAPAIVSENDGYKPRFVMPKKYSKASIWCKNQEARQAHKELLTFVATFKILSDDNLAEERKATVRKHAKIIYFALEDDVELQLQLAT